MLHRTDKWVGLASILTLALWGLNVPVSSVYLLYVNVLLVSALFAYVIWRADPQGELRRSWPIGMIACVVYAYIDSLLSSIRFGMLFHLETNDWQPFGSTPLSLILMWGCLIAMALYFYQRVRSLWPKTYPALLITAGVLFLGGFAFEWLGNAAHLWSWNADQVRTGYILSVPVFVPISYAIAGIFAPYVLKNSLVGGLRCGVMIGVVRFSGFVLIRYFSVGV